jgi:hypothetical protein
MSDENEKKFYLEIIPYTPKNWLTPEGIWQVKRDLLPRFPDIRDARFLTFTINQNLFTHPENAYEVGKARIREAMRFLRLNLGVTFEECPYWWKLEFQENGWPHWHLIFLYRKKVDLDLVDRCWTLGDTNTKRIRQEDFDYCFKYVTKDFELPGWVQDYPDQIRFSQASAGFLKPVATRKREEDPIDQDGRVYCVATGQMESAEDYALRSWAVETDQASAWSPSPSWLGILCVVAAVIRNSLQPKTIRQKLYYWERLARSVEVDETGKRFFARLALSAPFWQLMNKNALALSLCGGFISIKKAALRNIEQWRKWTQQNLPIRQPILNYSQTSWQLAV